MTEPVPRSQAPDVPVCPRHPDRESYVRCQRCDRPVCPQCQRQAAVGVQCVDCVSAGSKGTRQARTTFGGQVAGGRPVVTLSIIGASVAAFLLQWLVPGFTSWFAYVPFLSVAEPWRFLTSAFLHSTGFLLHIAFNMYALWLLGPYLESLFGRARFAALYLIAAFGGSVGYLALSSPANPQEWFGLVLGASGAVFGLFGALVVVQRRLGRQMGQVLVIIAINGVIGFLHPQIAWEAHLGGLLTGAAVSAALAYAPRRGRTAVQVGGLGAVVLVLLVIAMVRLITAAV